MREYTYKAVNYGGGVWMVEQVGPSGKVVGHVGGYFDSESEAKRYAEDKSARKANH